MLNPEMGRMGDEDPSTTFSAEPQDLCRRATDSMWYVCGNMSTIAARLTR